MKKEQILEIWDKVLKGDQDAKDTLVGLYLSKFPHNSWITENINKSNLHTMYLHLINKNDNEN